MNLRNQSRAVIALVFVALLAVFLGSQAYATDSEELPVGTPVPIETGHVTQPKPTVWRHQPADSRRAQPFATEDEFVKWFLSPNGGLKDMKTNGLPAHIRARVEGGMTHKIFNDFTIHGPVLSGKLRVTWSSISRALRGDRYDSITTGRSGRPRRHVIMGFETGDINRIYVEGRELVWIIDTMPTGEQMVRIERKQLKAEPTPIMEPSSVPSAEPQGTPSPWPSCAPTAPPSPGASGSPWVNPSASPNSCVVPAGAPSTGSGTTLDSAPINPK